jgi:hypothetical protein
MAVRAVSTTKVERLGFLSRMCLIGNAMRRLRPPATGDRVATHDLINFDEGRIPCASKTLSD